MNEFNRSLTIEKRINDFSQGYRQNLAILGDDKDQLSNLLDKCINNNFSYESLTIVQVDTDYVDQQGFLKSLVFALLTNYLKKEATTLDNLINSSETKLPNTIGHIKDLLKKNTCSFKDCLTVLTNFLQDTNEKCLFVIEEFLQLSLIFPSLYKDFSQFLIAQKKCMTILTSINHSQARKILGSDLSLLFGNFEKINLREDNFVEAYLYLRKLLYPIVPTSFFLSFFINMIGTNQTYYRFISDKIKEKYQKDNERESIVDIVQEYLFNQENYIFQKFIGKIEQVKNSIKDYPTSLKILLALSQGYLRKNELLSLNICNSKTFNYFLTKLIDTNCVDNLGNVYKIKDPFFSFWLRNSFKFLINPAVADRVKRRECFIKNLSETLIVFEEEYSQDRKKKVLDLFAAFKDDILQLGKDRYKLPTIEKADIILTDQDKAYLIAEGKEVIFAAILENKVEDQDVLEFIEKGQSIQGKKVKKIIISFDRCTSTAKLIAKNNKLILWDIDQLNYLMRIYNKPLFVSHAYSSTV